MAKNKANDGLPSGGGVVESAGNTDIDMLLAASAQSDAPLHRFKDSFALLMVDVVGSPAFFERYGETAMLVMLQQHNELVVPVVHESGGTIVRSVGDTALALFDSAANAARSAVRIQQRIDEYDRTRKPSERFHCRIALGHSAGPADDSKIFESVVNEVGLIGKACQGGQILLSGVMKEALQGTQSLQMRKASFAGKKGVKGLKDVYEIEWTPELKTSAIVNPAEEQAAADSAAPAPKVAEPVEEKTGHKLGRYEILEEIGVGGMGVVYKANDPMVGRTIAIKTVRLDSKGKERDELVRRLRLEAHAAGRLEHPAIVTIYDAGEAEGVFYLAMQFVEGRPLSASLAERLLLPVKQILTMMEEISDGLYYAHEREIVHRDLKPANIVLTPAGKPKILDFGIAKISDSGLTKAGTILGTPNYMSPEQASGRRIDRRSDIFSLGSILYELLTGERAFAGSAPTAVLHKIREENPIPLRKIDPTIEPALENVVNKALAKDPFARYQTCAELRDDLAAVRTGQAATSAPPPQPGTYMGATVVMTPAPDSQAPTVATPVPATPTPTPTPPPLPTGMGLSPGAGPAADAAPVTPHSPAPGTVPSVPRTHGTGVAPPKKSFGVLRVMVLLLLLSVIGVGVGINQGLIPPEQLEFLGPAFPYLAPLFPVARQGVTPPPQQETPAVITAGEGDSTPDTAPVSTDKQETTAGDTDKPAQAGVTPPAGTGTDTPATSTKPGTKTGSTDTATPATEVPKTPVTDAASKTVTKEPVKTPETKTPRRRTRPEPKLTEQEQARVKILITQARNFMNQNRLNFAERRLQSALKIDPSNQEAQKMLEDIRQRRRLPPR